MAVDDEAFPHAFVTVRGTAEVAVCPDDLRIWTTRIAARYVGRERAEECATFSSLRGDVLVTGTVVLL